MYYISYNSDHKIRNFSGSNLQRPEKQTKKSSLKKFLVSYNIFAIYTAVKHREILCEKKKQQQEQQHLDITLWIIKYIFKRFITEKSARFFKYVKPEISK